MLSRSVRTGGGSRFVGSLIDSSEGRVNQPVTLHSCKSVRLVHFNVLAVLTEFQVIVTVEEK